MPTHSTDRPLKRHRDWHAGTFGPDPGLRARGKRAFDILAGAMILLAVLPLMLGLALLIGLVDGWPVIYRHRRVGRHGRPFQCLKFRTMARDSEGILARHLATCPEAAAEWQRCRKLRSDPRIIGPVGRFLRQTSFDELPQILNVLRGDMSLVGPRPVTSSELIHYDSDLHWYYSTRPGLTGPWQISGRSDTTFGTRVALDVDYARNLSLRRDLAILVRTPAALLSGKGAY